MVIIGLDPGLARTGFGAIDTQRQSPFLRCGCLTTPSSSSIPDRLHSIGQDLSLLLTEIKPNLAVVETVFFGNNSKTAMQTAETRGVLLYILRQHTIPVHSLTPLQIKSRLTGYGQADKHQVQRLVTRRLQLTTIPHPDDAADALAAALCWADEPIHTLHHV
jgi:crossover junction endodeoxyribonuclease RuvC